MNILVAILILLGTAFAAIAALGVLRFPDTFSRLHAATKAGAFGGTLLLLAAALFFGSVRATVLALLAIIFFYMTAPIAAHIMARTQKHRDER